MMTWSWCVAAVGGWRSSGSAWIGFGTQVTNLFIYLYRVNTRRDIADRSWNVAEKEFRNWHHLFKPGKSIRQTCLSIFYTHPLCVSLSLSYVVVFPLPRKNAATSVSFLWKELMCRIFIASSVCLPLSVVYFDKLNPLE